MIFELTSREMYEAIRDYVEKKRGIELPACEITLLFNSGNDDKFSAKLKPVPDEEIEETKC